MIPAHPCFRDAARGDTPRAWRDDGLLRDLDWDGFQAPLDIRFVRAPLVVDTALQTQLCESAIDVCQQAVRLAHDGTTLEVLRRAGDASVVAALLGGDDLEHRLGAHPHFF